MQSLTPTLETAPVKPLITLDEAKQQVRRDDNDDDLILTRLIAVVMSRLDGADGILGRALITQTWSESFDAFPAGATLCLALAPVIDITEITYFSSIDQSGMTMPAGDYSAFNRSRRAYVKLGYGRSWPSSYEQDDAVTVTYQAGYGLNASDVPAAIKHAAMMMLAHYYENREAVLVGTIASDLPQGIMTLLRPFIRPHF